MRLRKTRNKINAKEEIEIEDTEMKVRGAEAKETMIIKDIHVMTNLSIGLFLEICQREFLMTSA